MDKQQLIDKFAIKDIFTIDENEQGLIRATITTYTGTGEIYLQGAHITKWQPKGHEPVLFLSKKSGFAQGKAIRGGIPVIFPWFGARTATKENARTDGPSHGFARTSNWQLTSATMNGDDLHLILVLDSNEETKALGYDQFTATYEITFGNELELKLKIENHSNSVLHFEEALHTYLSVSDATKVSIMGLRDTEYLDKTDGFKRKRQNESTLKLTGETDRPYLNTQHRMELHDPEPKRVIGIEKINSDTTIVWNPWSELTAKMADMEPDDWKHMVCIESGNAAENAISLQAGEQHIMHTNITVALR